MTDFDGSNYGSGREAGAAKTLLCAAKFLMRHIGGATEQHIVNIAVRSTQGQADRPNFRGLILGCIDAKFCN